MTIDEAAKILGVDRETVRKWQTEGDIPKPIPDDYFNAVIQFRIDLEQAARRRFDKQREVSDGSR